jgi:hypothetical protein
MGLGGGGGCLSGSVCVSLGNCVCVRVELVYLVITS